jgi:hypothetical protein
MERVVAKFRTFEEARQATLAYYRRLSPAERLEILFTLRDMARKEDDASSQRLARVYRIAKLQRTCVTIGTQAPRQAGSASPALWTCGSSRPWEGIEKPQD